ncbi:hypothetical protein [Clostridium omnivorum]|uniref:Uncharacterized protein n=1 Tax=Clostridium omnivorum TaxID=1604902 RepID=A0ABQ5N658_9CLOT|nr:hypothetical protein [Clostridium sp. E14]GLC30694.1 hypothetical protein bsdE14_21040 [Clostridium sp. E14]
MSSMVINSSNNQLSKKIFLSVGACVLLALLFQITGGFGFEISKITGLSEVAIGAGITLAYNAYRRGQSFKRALSIFFSWCIVSILISIGLDLLLWLIARYGIPYVASW